MRLERRRLLKLAARHSANMLNNATGSVARAELFYARVFESAVSRLGIRLPPMYPVRGAANYSLLYALLRSATELPIRSIIEFGAGQSTVLFDAIVQNVRTDLAVVTIESDKTWAEQYQKKVQHEVRHVPLANKGLESEKFDGKIEGNYDLLLIDGPTGKKRNSRWSSAGLVQSLIADEFLIIIDDVERPGERNTLQRLLNELGDRPQAVSFIHGNNSQGLICSAAYTSAVYF